MPRKAYKYCTFEGCPLSFLLLHFSSNIRTRVTKVNSALQPMLNHANEPHQNSAQPVLEIQLRKLLEQKENIVNSNVYDHLKAAGLWKQ